jgi:hypothetical protein
MMISKCLIVRQTKSEQARKKDGRGRAGMIEGDLRQAG